MVGKKPPTTMAWATYLGVKIILQDGITTIFVSNHQNVKDINEFNQDALNTCIERLKRNEYTPFFKIPVHHNVIHLYNENFETFKTLVENETNGIPFGSEIKHHYHHIIGQPIENERCKKCYEFHEKGVGECEPIKIKTHYEDDNETIQQEFNTGKTRFAFKNVAERMERLELDWHFHHLPMYMDLPRINRQFEWVLNEYEFGIFSELVDKEEDRLVNAVSTIERAYLLYMFRKRRIWASNTFKKHYLEHLLHPNHPYIKRKMDDHSGK
jgi:hypothetical protein